MRKQKFHPGSKSVLGLRPEERPATILYEHIASEASSNSQADIERSIQRFSEKVGIPLGRLKEVLGGGIPTAFEIDQVCDHLNWSPTYIYGVTESAMEARIQSWFYDKGIENPTSADRLEFEEFYDDLLKIKHTKKAGSDHV